MTHDMYDIRRGDHSSHVSFDSPERRSERKDLEEGAGGSARGKGIEGKRAPALKRTTLVHHWKDVVLPQLVAFSQSLKKALSLPVNCYLSRYKQAKELQHRKYILQVLICECIFRARAVYSCTHEGRELSGLLVSVRSLKLCPSRRDVPVGVSVRCCETELKMTEV